MKTFSEFREEKLNEAIDPELKKYGIKELKDGLTIEQIKKEFSWILKAKIKGAILGFKHDKWRNENRFVWYDGVWYDGVWEGRISDAIWYTGTWKNGVWKDGVWYDGIWEDGEWNSGVWVKGTWKDGTRYGGTWKGGVWKTGSGKPDNA